MRIASCDYKLKRLNKNISRIWSPDYDFKMTVNKKEHQKESVMITSKMYGKNF